MNLDQQPTDPPNQPTEQLVRDWAKAHMSARRFAHTAGVVATVTKLARQYHIPELAELRLAGWLHDAAKERSDADLLAEAQRLGCAISPIEAASPALLHGAVALGLAREAWGIEHPTITTAVLYHTTGHPDMTPGDKVFYLADLIEPSRKYGWIEQARQLAADDLDTALLFAITYQIRRLLKQGAIVDESGLQLRNKLLISGVKQVPRE